MTIAGLDLETTGLDYEKGHRIIEVGILKYEYNGSSHHLIDKLVVRVHPDRSISADAIAVHGITLSDLAGCPVFKDVAASIDAFMSDVDLLVGHNLIKFDAPFFAFEMMAAGYTFKPGLECVDTLEARWATPNGKTPNLGELCYALEEDYDPEAAHSAEYDIEKTMACFFKGLELGFYKLPEGLK